MLMSPQGVWITAGNIHGYDHPGMDGYKVESLE